MRRAVIALSALLPLLLLLSPVAAAVDLPASPGGQAMKAYIEAMAANDTATFERLIDEYLGASSRSREDQVASLQRLASFIGVLDVHSVTEDSATRIAVLAKRQRDGRWMNLFFDLDSEQRPTEIGMTPASPPASLELPARTEAAAVAALRAHIEKLVGEDRFSGAVRLSRGDKVLLEGAWGQADKRFAVDNQTTTRFNLGSMNKMYTAVAIGQLVEAGKLAFEDRLIEVMPAYPNREVAEKVTIHHLLTHSSGLGSYWEPLFATNWTQIRTHAQLLDLFVDEPLEHEPGERFGYSNSGYVVLGRVIETLSGMSYFDYVREKIFKPAGMTATDSYAYDEIVADLATGYTRASDDHDHGPGHEEATGPRRANVFEHAAKGCAAGGGYSTVGDLHRFVRALDQNVLMHAATRDRLFKPQAPGVPYGYGFGIRGEGRMRSVGHNGGAAGISSDLRFYPESGYSFSVLANYDPGTAERVADELHLLLQSIR